LSDKERAALSAEGKCFKCKEPGHLSRNCKTNNSVTASGSKPPGFTAHRVDFVTEDNDNGILESLPVGMAIFSERERDSRDPPRVPVLGPWTKYEDWFEPSETRSIRKHIGEASEMLAMQLLNENQPYPGDPPVVLEQGRGGIPFRYKLRVSNRREYMIYDQLRQICTPVKITDLESEEFNIVEHWATFCSRRSGIAREGYWGRPMGKPHLEVATALLRDG
ncbi:hypothetical protein BJ165DRAFT_1316969, partial [Panaeolus papilionaceus]